MRRSTFGAAVGFVVLAIMVLAIPANIRGAQQNVDDNIKFAITVYYTEPLTNLIGKGHYQIIERNVDKFIQGDTPGTEIKRLYDAELVHVGARMGHDLVLKEIASRGLRPVTPTELLTFGMLYPDEQKKFPVVALGTVNGGQVLYLWAIGKDRLVGLDFVKANTVWRAGCRFLAVPL